MLRGPISLSVLLAALTGCPGGGRGAGESCGGGDDCDGTLQCLNSRCVARCARAPDCGDGYACNDQGLCQAAHGQSGDSCHSEVDCLAGLSCQLDGAALGIDARLLASCTAQNATRPAGAACDDDVDCRNGTCALGRCTDLCRDDRDCGAGTVCVAVPRVLASGALFGGCMPKTGAVTWSIPVNAPSAEVLLPVPQGTRSAALVISSDDDTQRVGAAGVLSPRGHRIYVSPCPVGVLCATEAALDSYYTNPVRHLPAVGQSVLAMPSGTKSAAALETGAYRVSVSSFRQSDIPGSAIPRVTAVVQFGTGVLLDLHFFFLNLDQHPCLRAGKLSAASAPGDAYFQNEYLARLRDIITGAGLTVGDLTYEDVRGRPELDALDRSQVGALLRLGRYATGINVFFVRSLSPIGVPAYGPNPGPAGLAGTPQSGIVIPIDTLCYREPADVARLTAHEIARYMGLYHNVESDGANHAERRDLIDDTTDAPDNLLFFSERGGTQVTPGQRDILSRSAVLR